MGTVEVKNSYSEQALPLQNITFSGTENQSVWGGKGESIQFRISKDFTATVQHSVFGNARGLLQEKVGEKIAQNSFQLDTGSASLHNKCTFLTDHRRDDIPLTASENLNYSKPNAVTAI